MKKVNIIRGKETWKQPNNFIEKAQQDLYADDYVPYEKEIVLAVDKILEMVKQRGYPSLVENEKDWQIVEYIYKIFGTLYPKQNEDFIKKQKWNKTNQLNKNASHREKGGAQVRHIIELPMKFAQLLEVAFPMQKLQDKKFALEFGRRLSLFRWADKL